MIESRLRFVSNFSLIFVKFLLYSIDDNCWINCHEICVDFFGNGFAHFFGLLTANAAHFNICKSLLTQFLRGS